MSVDHKRTTSRVMILGANDTIKTRLFDRLNKSPRIETCQHLSDLDDNPTDLLTKQGIDTVVYVPRLCSSVLSTPDLIEAETVCNACSAADLQKVVLLSSAVVYGASPYNPALMSEPRQPSRKWPNAIRQQWQQLEAIAEKALAHRPETTLIILRPVTVPTRDGTDYFSRLITGRLAVTLPLYDPPMQWLSPCDLAQAVCGAVEHDTSGVFNVAPDGVVPLRRALHMAGVKRLPLSSLVQRATRPVLATLGATDAMDQLDYIRYTWTVSNRKIKRAWGFAPEHSSISTLIGLRKNPSPVPLIFDDFGMDPDYIDAWRQRLFRWLHDYYWRIEVKGIEHVPPAGGALLVGTHRGFMPFDGAMMLHLIARDIGRYVRFLVHPGLIKTPIPFNMEKLGGISACQENADAILQRDGLLGFLPEGIEGAFRYYRQAYTLGNFGRHEFVKTALRNRAPIVPFVTVGSAEIFPVVAKIRWAWWQRTTLWPCFPIAPPFPLLPLPLPSKWHTRFLEPLHVEKHYPPEAATDAGIVQSIGQAVKRRMQTAMDDMRRRRTSFFFGSIFNDGEN